MNKQDISFLEKFINKDVFFKNSNALYNSIIHEIARILSSKLRSRYDAKANYSYGIPDTFSLETSKNDLEEFAKQCCKTILRLEPRICDIKVHQIAFDKTKQNLNLNIICYLRSNQHFSFNLKI